MACSDTSIDEFHRISKGIAENLININCDQKTFEIVLGKIITEYSKLAGFNRDEIVSHLILFECDKVAKYEDERSK